ncbi:MAG TPA: enterochelin esterase, partial [Thermoanaerobaculia bacterium]|nr:enterochelin esterase [Thermoanaerobaculia bacterium]
MSALAIQELLQAKPPGGDAIQSFIAAHTFPLVEGSSTTFLYYGHGEEVRLRHFIYGLPSSRPMKRVEGTDLWYVVEEVPPGSRIEYKIEIVHGNERHWILDPLNPHTARDP